VSAAGTQARASRLDATAMLLMVGLTMSWGLNSVAAKVGLTGFNPILLCVLRSTIAGVAVLGWCRFRRIPVFGRDRTLWAGIAAGILFGLEFTLIFLSLDYTSVARSVLLTNTMPFWVLVGAHLLLDERMSLAKLAGVCLAFGGVALVFSDRLNAPGPDAWIGDLMALMAGLSWGLTTLVVRRSPLAHATPEKVLLYQLTVSAIVVSPLMPLGGALLREVGPVSIAALAFQSLFIAAFTYVLWFGLVKRYPAAALSSFAVLTPVFGVLLAGILLAEPLSAGIIASLVLIAAGLMLVNRPSPQRKQTHA
jgi:Permeases of the drug/metabolite transporter (DMT) superfamily